VTAEGRDGNDHSRLRRRLLVLVLLLVVVLVLPLMASAIGFGGVYCLGPCVCGVVWCGRR
jgi:hypothetical protein